MSAHRSLDDVPDLVALARAGSAEPRRRRHCRTAASQPARLNTKTIAGSRPSRSSRSSTSTRSACTRPRCGVRRWPPRLGRRSPNRASRCSSRAYRTSSGLTRPLPVVGAAGDEQVEQARADHDVLPQRHRAALLDDDVGVAADGRQPLAELLGVGHGRRQRDQPDRLRQVDDHLFPDRAAEPVGKVVNLVHDHVTEPRQAWRPGVEHVAQDLGGHHHDRRIAVDRVVAGEQADTLAGPCRATRSWYFWLDRALIGVV